MTRSISRLVSMLSGTACLLGATGAHAASKIELVVAGNVAATWSVSRIESSISPANIIAADLRQTNLRKTANFVIVSGIESTRRQRSTR